jgi:hypothetical protein
VLYLKKFQQKPTETGWEKVSFLSTYSFKVGKGGQKTAAMVSSYKITICV